MGALACARADAHADALTRVYLYSKPEKRHRSCSSCSPRGPPRHLIPGQSVLDPRCGRLKRETGRSVYGQLRRLRCNFELKLEAGSHWSGTIRERKITPDFMNLPKQQWHKNKQQQQKRKKKKRTSNKMNETMRKRMNA